MRPRSLSLPLALLCLSLPLSQLPPVLPRSEKLGNMVEKSGWPPRYRALLWAMAGNQLRRTAEANARSVLRPSSVCLRMLLGMRP